MEDALQLLNSIYPLAPSTINYLKDHIRFKSVKKDDMLLVPGQISKQIFFIQKGLLRAFKIKNDIEVSVWFMKERDLCVDVQSFYLKIESTKYIHALEDTDVFYLTRDDLDYLYINNMEFNFVSRELITQYFLLWDERLDAIAMQTAEERYLWLIQNHPELLQRVQQRYLASYFNMTEVTFSKMKRKIQTAGGKTSRIMTRHTNHR